MISSLGNESLTYKTIYGFSDYELHLHIVVYWDILEENLNNIKTLSFAKYNV